MTGLTLVQVDAATARAHRPQRDKAAYAREDLLRPDLLPEPPQRGQVDGDEREAGLEHPHEGFGGVCPGQVLDLMGVQFDRDGEPRDDRAEGDEGREEDEEHGEPPLKGGVEPPDAGDRHHDHSGLDQEV